MALSDAKRRPSYVEHADHDGFAAARFHDDASRHRHAGIVTRYDARDGRVGERRPDDAAAHLNPQAGFLGDR
jgi:hypothetical protein